MKLTTFIILIALMQASAASFGQKISLSERNVPLEKVLKSIEQKSGYVFFYDAKDLPNARVSVKLENADIEEALKSSIKDLPLKWEIVKNNVFLKKEEPSFIDRIVARFQAIDVRGRVVDEKGQGIPGATVKVKDGKQGTITDSKGNFELNGIDEGATLVISFLGYQNKEISANKELGEIALELSTSKLDEVQVVAYGKTTKRFDIGNVASVKASDIEFSPVTNPLLAIQGRVTGINITQTSGYAGGTLNVQIQGQNSMINGSKPFIVVDGVPYPDQMLPNNAGVLTGNGSNGNVLSYLNPADIESISVLKDADATAIYGSRAANGAILITTKKGAKVGAMRTDVRFDQGWQTAASFAKLLNTQQYLEMRHEGLKNSSAVVGDRDYDLNGAWDTTRYTDWQKELFKTAKYTNLSGNISGGWDNVSYLAGATYHRETGVTPIQTPNQIFSFHSSLSTSSANRRFKTTVTSNFQYNDNRLPGTDVAFYANTYAPDAPELYNPDGSLNWQPAKNTLSSFSNPVAYSAMRFEKLKISNLGLSGDLSYEIFPGFQTKLVGGFTQMNQNDVNGIPLSAVRPSSRPTSTNRSSFSTGRQSTWNIEPQLNFQKDLGQSRLDVLLGGTLQQQERRSYGFTGSDYSSELLLENPAAAGRISDFASGASAYRYNAIFGRINYRYKDRYLLSSSIRRDGSSRFGPANRFSNFYSVGGGWIFTEEGFAKSIKPVLSFGKLRVNYGTTGNDQVGDYSYINSYGSYGVGVAYNGVAALVPGQLFNPYLQWEQTRKLSAGINLGFLKDHILVDVSWYRNRSSNQLMNIPVPTTTGFNSIQTNLPALVQNTGLEISLTTVNVKKRDFEWTSSFNITRNRNKLLKFDHLEENGFSNDFFIGRSLGTRKYFKYGGVNPTTGNYQFVKADGTLTEDPDYDQDRTQFIDLQPAFYGGFNNTILWKGFSLDFLLQFAKNKSTNYSFGIVEPPGSYNRNQPVSVLSRWRKPGDQTDVQRFASDFSNSYQYGLRQGSDGGFVDVHYLRLKNISLTYQLPPSWLKVVRSVQIYLQGQNVLTFSNSLFDPETGSYFPVLRTVTAGIKLGL